MTISIGILAGMGPRSTTPFLELVLDECQKQYGAKYDIDYPHIIVYSLPTPFYIDREINEVELKQSIIEGAKRLDTCGVNIIAIPCNTAHKFYEEIKQSCKAKVLNIIDETMKNIPLNSKVTVLATTSTISSNLYQNGISKRNCKFVFVDDWQQEVNKIISMIKQKTDKSIVMQSWNKLMDRATSKGISNVVLGCTDLSVIDTSMLNIKLIDSSVALAQALVKEYLALKG